MPHFALIRKGIAMKRIIALVVAIVLASSYVSVCAYEDSELSLALENAQSLPEQLNYTVDFEVERTNVLHMYFNSDEGITRLSALNYLLKAIGMDSYDFEIYRSIRKNRSRGYEDYPFRDLWQSAGEVDMAFDLGIVYGNGEGRFRCKDRLSCNEAVALVMRCIYDNTERDINVLFEKAKEMGVIKESDRFYNDRDSIIKAEEWMILLYRMRMHKLVIVPVTNTLTDAYMEGVADYKYDLITEWKNKPARRGFLFNELKDKYNFKRSNISKEDLVDMLGAYDKEVLSKEHPKVYYYTYVFDYEADEDDKYVDVYQEATVIFELDEEGYVEGEPDLYYGEAGGFAQTLDLRNSDNPKVDIEWFFYHPSFYYDAFEEKTRRLSKAVFDNEKEQLENMVDLVNDLLKDKERVMICNFIIKKDGTYKYNVYDEGYNDFKESLSSEQIDIIENYLFSINEKYEGSDSVEVFGYKDRITFELYSDMGANTGLVYCKELPKYFYDYPELIEIGDGWYYFRSNYMD